MTTKNKILIIVIAAILGAVAIVCFHQPLAPEVSAPAKAAASSPTATKSAGIVPVTSQVMQPIVQPAPIGSAADAPNADLQSELRTAIPDMIGLLQSGDEAAYFLKYGITPADWASFSEETKAQTLANLQDQSPEAQEYRQNLITMLGYLQGETPAYSATGDQATYQFTPTPDMAAVGGRGQISAYHFIFKKTDGRWYLVSQGPGTPKS